MSQTSSATAPVRPGSAPVPTIPAPAVPVPLGSTPAEVASPVGSTPAWLRRLRRLVVSTGVALAVLGTAAMLLLTLTLHRGANDVEQLLRVQTIESDLLVADANATNSFLVGGLESPQRRAAYDTALAEVADLVARSARAQPADAAALSALNADVLDYAQLVEAARANNRQGLPVGAQYLREASNGLRADALPVADALVQANVSRTDTALTTGWGWAVPLLALAALVVLVVVQVRVARRFRRRINAGLLTASLVLLVLALASTVLMTRLFFSTELATGSGDVAAKAGDARIQGNLAKSSESLTLIARGSGQAYEQSWQASAAAVRERLTTDRILSSSVSDFDSYAEVHRKIRALDDGGSWDAAVALAVGSDEQSSNAAFAGFDQDMADLASSSGASAVQELRSSEPGLVLGCLLTLLAGLATAWAGSRGIAARLREYR